MTKAQVILITGANRGIGWSTAQALSEQGHCVYLASRNFEEAQKLSRESVHSQNLIPIQLDVTSDASVEAAYAEILKRSQKLDALVNNSGLLLDDQSQLNKTTLDIYQKTFEVNFFGAIRVTQAMLPLLLKSTLEKPELPKIINVSSSWGSMSSMEKEIAPVPAYHTSKAALNMLTLNMANNYKSKIAVNSICPGWCRTRMGGDSAIQSAETGSIVIQKLINSSEPTSGMFLNQHGVVEW